MRDLTQLTDLVRSGDQQATDAVRAAGQVLGQGLRCLAITLNPELFVVGGELAGLGDVLLEPVREGLGGSSFEAAPKVAAASLGERASLCGALALVLTGSTASGGRSSDAISAGRRPRASFQLAGL